MTDRIRLDDLTSNQLDALYAEIDRLTAELDDYERRVETLTAQLARVQRLADDHPVDIDTALILEVLPDTNQPATKEN